MYIILYYTYGNVQKRFLLSVSKQIESAMACGATSNGTMLVSDLAATQWTQ